MFKCDTCHEDVGPRIPEIHVITQTRKRVYKNEHGHESNGTEIVKQIRVCEDCSITFHKSMVN